MSMQEIVTKEWKTMLSVLAIVAGTLLLWLWLARASSRARRRYQDLLAQEEPDLQSELAGVQRRLTALHLLVNTGKYVLTATALLLVLRQLDIKLDSLLLPAGFLGAALGLGAQNLVRDVVAGFFIIFEGQFAVGDIVSINGVLGTVEEVGLRVTRLHDDAAQIHFFPNGAITTVAKYSRRHVPLSLFVPLADAAQAEKSTQLVRQTLHRFDLQYNAFDGEPEVVESAGVAPPASDEKTSSSPPAQDKLEQSSTESSTATVPRLLCCRLLVWPPRVVATREKLPSLLKAALDEAQIPTQTGALIEVINAPVA